MSARKHLKAKVAGHDPRWHADPQVVAVGRALFLARQRAAQEWAAGHGLEPAKVAA
jgi:hypothetical protein